MIRKERLGWQLHEDARCAYRDEEVKARVVDGCLGGAYLIDHSAFRSLKYDGTDRVGGSVHLSSGKSVVVTSTLFNDSVTYSRGACLRAEGFSFARFEWDCFLKSRTTYSDGQGQATSLESQTNSSLHLSSTIEECSPDTSQGQLYTIHFETSSHKSIISFNNLSNNKVYQYGAWRWPGIGGEGTMNTVANNTMAWLFYINTKPSSMSFTNIVGNKYSPYNNYGIFSIASGSLDVLSSFIISNNYSKLNYYSGSLIFRETIFYDNEFSASPIVAALPFTHSLHISQDWECGTIPPDPTRKFNIKSSIFKKVIFVSFAIING